MCLSALLLRLMVLRCVMVLVALYSVGNSVKGLSVVLSMVPCGTLVL